jgi:hypothetical protein
MKDFITAKERLTNPYFKNIISDAVYLLLGFGLLFYLLIEITNIGVNHV